MSEFRIPTMTKRVTLTNLVPAISSLSFYTGVLSTEHAKYGSSSVCITGIANDNEEYATSKTSFELLDPTHFYYACVEVYQETALGSFDFFFPNSTPSVFGGQTAKTAGKWNLYSNVTTRSSFTAGSYPFRLDFNNGGTAGKAWFDGVMIIDLTEAFGAGNEPGNAWCQANIPYFIGSYAIDIPLNSPIQALVTGLTIPVPKIVVPETSETDLRYEVNHGNDWSMLKQNTKLVEGDNYLVVVDGVQYSCTAYFNNEYGETRIGDSRLGMVWDDSTGEEIPDTSHAEDVPFFIYHFISAEGSSYTSFAMYVIYPDSETHTIEIKKMVDKSVTKITDASGRVIWDSNNVFVTGNGYGGSITGGYYSFAYIEVNGSTYTESVDLSLKADTIIKCCVWDSYGSKATIKLNNAIVVQSDDSSSYSYEYIVKKNIKVSINLDYYFYDTMGGYGMITITEE